MDTKKKLYFCAHFFTGSAYTHCCVTEKSVLHAKPQKNVTWIVINGEFNWITNLQDIEEINVYFLKLFDFNVFKFNVLFLVSI